MKIPDYHHWALEPAPHSQSQAPRTHVAAKQSLLLAIMVSTLAGTSSLVPACAGVAARENYPETPSIPTDPAAAVYHVPCRGQWLTLLLKAWSLSACPSGGKGWGTSSTSPRKHLGSRILGDANLTGNNKAGNLAGTVYSKRWYVLYGWP